jgi:hypothetical protein
MSYAGCFWVDKQQLLPVLKHNVGVGVIGINTAFHKNLELEKNLQILQALLREALFNL